MTKYVDISMRIADPIDEFRLFDMARDGAAAAELYGRIAPRAEEGRCVLAPPLYYLLAAGAADVRAVNDHVLAQARQDAKVVATVGVVEPKHDDEAVRELERLASLGAKGVMWSPRAQGMFSDDTRLGPLLRRAHELGLRSIFRAAAYSMNEALWRTWRLARQLPEIPIIVTGALQNYDNGQLIEAGAGGPDNVVYDTAGWTTSTNPVRMLAVLGEERLLFGSGALGPADEAAAALERHLQRSGVAAAVIERVMWKNAASHVRLELA